MIQDKDYKFSAQKFIQEERQFHLGDLVTEQPHPKTVSLSEKTVEKTGEGVKMLLEVDMDIYPVAKRIIPSTEFDKLVKSIQNCLINGGTVCFSSCGASGRLAIILESVWRSFWMQQARADPGKAELYKNFENQAYSIMTGGDRALIRSVENFEDYQSFGRMQVKEAGLGEGDILIALTEGGEISSVIGTMKEALDRNAGVFMIYNNPAEILRARFERSREMLDHPEVVKIDLTTGPMALSGSTRMQATSIAMLAMGAALEESFTNIIDEQGHGSEYSGGVKAKNKQLRQDYPEIFRELILQLNGKDAVDGISRLVDIEADCYMHSGRVTYIADQYLLDIFSDTTERAPTFMIPPFRQYDDKSAPVPWAFARDPLRPSGEAWINLLKRAPRGLNWTKSDYQNMGAPRELQDNPPPLDNSQILKFYIGGEDDPSRYSSARSVLMRVLVDENDNPEFDDWWLVNSPRYSHPVCLTIGSRRMACPGAENIHIPLDLRPTGINLFEHIAVKVIFNTLSTATMAKIGRIQGNWMIQLDATNKKLTDRATRIIAHFSGLTYNQACHELFRTMNEPAAHRLRFENSYIVQTLDRLGISLTNK